jgi:hypothetical protein
VHSSNFTLDIFTQTYESVVSVFETVFVEQHIESYINLGTFYHTFKTHSQNISHCDITQFDNILYKRMLT